MMTWHPEPNDIISRLDTNIDWIKNSPAHQFAGWGNVVLSMEDAMEWMEKQQPHVMTFEEALDNDFVWFGRKSSPYLHVAALRWDGIGSVRVHRLVDSPTYEDHHSYGNWWRCWNAKPTDKQRKAVEWDAEPV
jgi:hypothetical protein